MGNHKIKSVLKNRYFFYFKSEPDPFSTKRTRRSGSIPEPCQNETDPQHCLRISYLLIHLRGVTIGNYVCSMGFLSCFNLVHVRSFLYYLIVKLSSFGPILLLLLALLLRFGCIYLCIISFLLKLYSPSPLHQT